MYPDDYLSSSYGARLYGRTGPSWTYDDEGYCAEASDIPYYWLSSINQASRFGAWDCQNCDDGSCGHSTCTNPNRCDMFDDDCGFAARCDAFLVNDTEKYGVYCSSEGLCGGNLCFADGHCSAMFDPTSRIFGIGFEPNSNGITISYSSGYDSSIYELVNYSIPNVCHFDERMKINDEYKNSDGNYLQFILQYFDENVAASNAYVVYQGAKNEMNLDFGDSNNGFFVTNLQVHKVYPLLFFKCCHVLQSLYVFVCFVCFF